MILRVWAMYNQSKLILGALLTLYAAEVITSLIPCIITSAQKSPVGMWNLVSSYAHHITGFPRSLNHLVVTAQVLDYSFCVAQYYGSPIFPEVAAVIQMALGALICLLFAIQFIKESFQMYKVTKQFQLNRYMNLLVREGMVYFFA